MGAAFEAHKSVGGLLFFLFSAAIYILAWQKLKTPIIFFSSSIDRSLYLLFFPFSHHSVSWLLSTQGSGREGEYRTRNTVLRFDRIKGLKHAGVLSSHCCATKGHE